MAVLFRDCVHELRANTCADRPYMFMYVCVVCVPMYEVFGSWVLRPVGIHSD